MQPERRWSRSIRGCQEGRRDNRTGRWSPVSPVRLSRPLLLFVSCGAGQRVRGHLGVLCDSGVLTSMPAGR